VLPAFLATIGAGPVWLGAIEGIADGLSSFTKLAAGHYTDRLKRRKPLAVFGYAFTAISTHHSHSPPCVTMACAIRCMVGPRVRSPAKKALLCAECAGRTLTAAPRFERLMDTVGAIRGTPRLLWCWK